MSSARALAIARIAFACVVALEIALTPPNLERLFASIARANPDITSNEPGWLGHFLVHAAYASPLHYGAIVAGSALAALLTFAFVERRALWMTSPIGAFIAAILAAICSVDALHAGGGMMTFAFAAFAMVLVENPSLRSAIALGVLAIFWCNFDASGLLAAALALVSACARSFDRDAPELQRFGWLGFAFAAAGTLVGPLGIAFPAHALAALELAGAAGDYALWSPAAIAPHAYRFGVLALVLAAFLVGLRGRNVREGALGLLALLAALANGALVPLFGIVSAPILTAGYFGPRAYARDEATPTRSFRSTIFTATAIALVATIAGTVVGTRMMPIAPDQPYAALDRLAHGSGVHRVFCANVSWCDGARAIGLAVVADSGIANASPATRDADVRILQTRKTWRRDLDRLDIDTVVVHSNSSLATLLAATRWKTYAIAGNIAILLRDDGRP